MPQVVAQISSFCVKRIRFIRRWIIFKDFCDGALPFEIACILRFITPQISIKSSTFVPGSAPLIFCASDGTYAPDARLSELKMMCQSESAGLSLLPPPCAREICFHRSSSRLIPPKISHWSVTRMLPLSGTPFQHLDLFSIT